MTWPTWGSLAEQAINGMSTWDKVFGEGDMIIKYRQTIACVEASWWAVGKSPQEIEAEARKRLMEELQKR